MGKTLIDMNNLDKYFIKAELVPAIVSEELWEAANVVLSRRSKDVKNRQNICNHANLLTGKLFCTHCGKAYYRREQKTTRLGVFLFGLVV